MAVGKFSKRSRKSVQKVQIVKARKKRRGPKISRILKHKTTAHLRYVDTISIDSGTTIASHVFAANGLFDPDITGTGHQPLMFDEYTLLYNRYRVISSKCKVTPVGTTTSNLIPGLYGVFGDHDVTLTYALGNSVIEDMRNGGKWGIVGALNSTINQGFKTASYNALKELSPDGAGQSTPVTVNPTAAGLADYNFQVWVGSVNGNDPAAMILLVQLDYIVEFTDPKVLTPS